ncbi:unnamed protein product [Amoebophrya sp. A120]|nr:unnamed protein product [Amoebophrya sp. A120]|eukprot:GSA120T00019842001.1
MLIETIKMPTQRLSDLALNAYYCPKILHNNLGDSGGDIGDAAVQTATQSQSHKKTQAAAGRSSKADSNNPHAEQKQQHDETNQLNDLRKLAEPVYYYHREWTDQQDQMEKTLQALTRFDPADDKTLIKRKLDQADLQYSVLAETYTRFQGLVANLLSKLGMKCADAHPVHMPDIHKEDPEAEAKLEEENAGGETEDNVNAAGGGEAEDKKAGEAEADSTVVDGAEPGTEDANATKTAKDEVEDAEETIEV